MFYCLESDSTILITLIYCEDLQKVQGVQGSPSLHADQADLQYHEIQPDPEDLRAHQHPAKSQKQVFIELQQTVSS